MRQHLDLLTSFENQAITPFPLVAGEKISISRMKYIIPLHCICKMPESYDSRMVQCDSCDIWFHFKCISITEDPNDFDVSLTNTRTPGAHEPRVGGAKERLTSVDMR